MAGTVNEGNTLAHVKVSLIFLVHTLDANQRCVLMLVAKATFVAEHNAL